MPTQSGFGGKFFINFLIADMTGMLASAIDPAICVVLREISPGMELYLTARLLFCRGFWSIDVHIFFPFRRFT
jgi:hypothetical protein